MKIAIRTDASFLIGTGHVMRCKTLADELCSRGAEVRFVCRELPGHLIQLLRDVGYPTAVLPAPPTGVSIPSAGRDDYAVWLGVEQAEDARQTLEALGDFDPDWLVVDHYDLDAVWERMLRPRAHKLMVIDDLANRSHECDLLLDQNYYRDLDRRYQGLVPDKCVMLLGPAYVLLRPEFSDARQRPRVRDGSVRRILIFFGGSDPTNQTCKALDALKLLSKPEIAVDVVVGAANPCRDEIRFLCQEMLNVQYHCQASNIAELIAAADIAIGAGGATTWERCLLGLPTLTVVFADNQLQSSLDLESFGAILFLGWANKITAAQLARSIESLVANPALLSNISERAYLIMKEWLGTGVIAAAMNNILTADLASADEFQ